MVVALAIVAAIGDGTLRAVAEAGELSPGLNPSVRSDSQVLTGLSTAGSPSRAVEERAVCSSRPPGLQRAPGPLRAFFLGESVARRGSVHVAAVATARKLTVLIWHLLSKR